MLKFNYDTVSFAGMTEKSTYGTFYECINVYVYR